MINNVVNFLERMQSKYVKGADIKRQWNVSTQSLHRWADAGKIKSIRTPGGNRLYCSKDIESILGIGEETGSTVCYARCTSGKSRYFEEQINCFKEAYPGAEIISDVGSGLDFKRKGFNSLLDRLYSREISTIVVMHKDRLCSYGYEFLELLCKKSACGIVVLSRDESNNENFNEELAEDLLSVVSHFTAKRERSRTRTTINKTRAKGERTGSQN